MCMTQLRATVFLLVLCAIWVPVGHAQQDSVIANQLDEALRRVQQNPDSVADAARAVIATAESDKFRARAYAILGEALQNKGTLDESVKAYLEAITLADSLRFDDVLGSALNGIGITYYLLNDHDKSEHYILRAAEVKKAAGDYTLYTVILTNLAGLYFYQERYLEAAELLRGAEKELVEKHEERYLATVYNSLGGLYQTAFNQPDSAVLYYRKSIAYAERFDMPAGLISAWHNLGEVRLDQKQYSEALDHLNRAEALALEGSNDRYLITIYGTRSKVFDAMGDYASALADKQKELEFTNKVFELDRQRAIEELDIRYQTLEKEKQLRLSEERLAKEQNKRNLMLFALVLLGVMAVAVVLLIQQRRRSEQQLAREKAKIFANIVHEIRTPLTLISAPLTEIYRDKELSGRHSSRMALIRRQTDRLVRLVTELLDASKTDRASYKVVHEFGNPAVHLASLVEQFTDALAERNQTLELKIPGDEHWVSYPVNAFELGVNNLLSNACKYGTSNTPVVVSLDLVDATLLLSVTSCGKPLSKVQSVQVFERFERLSEHAEIAGSGIGLSTVREVTRLAGGDVELESGEPGYNRFTIRLPIEQVSLSKPPEEADADKPVVLVAEDDEELLRYTASVLQPTFSVLTASDGEQAYGLVRERIPDLVVTDVVMPGSDGFELLLKLRQDQLTSAIPVIMFSSRSSLDARLNALGQGADAYLPKPFDPDELRYIASNLIERMRLQASRYAARPAETAEERLQSEHGFVNQATQLVLQNLDNSEFSIEAFAEELNLSRSQLHRKLTQLTGLSSSHFIRKVRIEKAKDLLRTGEFSVSEVAYVTGFTSPSYFTRSFSESEGVSPTDFIRNAQ